MPEGNRSNATQQSLPAHITRHLGHADVAIQPDTQTAIATNTADLPKCFDRNLSPEARAEHYTGGEGYIPPAREDYCAAEFDAHRDRLLQDPHTDRRTLDDLARKQVQRNILLSSAAQQDIKAGMLCSSQRRDPTPGMEAAVARDYVQRYQAENPDLFEALQQKSQQLFRHMHQMGKQRRADPQAAADRVFTPVNEGPGRAHGRVSRRRPTVEVRFNKGQEVARRTVRSNTVER